MNLVKIIRIVLLILIIIGVGLLFTQKIWVPKLVDHIIANEKSLQTPLPAPETYQDKQPDISLVDGRQCYSYNHAATTDEPYEVNELIDISISGTNVTGTKSGTQKGPDMNNGYQGTLVGTLNKNIINATFSYTIEGSKNKEVEIYKAGLTGIEKMRYPLMEKQTELVPDTTKEYNILLYARVPCTPSN